MPALVANVFTSDRTPYDGKPFYCIECGVGLAEFVACELPDCTLESCETAKIRAQKHEQAARTRKDY